MKKILSILSVLSLIAVPFWASVHASPCLDEKQQSWLANFCAAGSLDEYLSAQEIMDADGEEILLDISSAVPGEVASQAGKGEEVCSCLTWRFSNDAAGKYYLKIGYQPMGDTLEEIQRELHINGMLPYSELSGFVLPREFTDAGEKTVDILGNEIRPAQTNLHRNTETYVFDYAGQHDTPLYVSLPAGENTLTLLNLRGEADILFVALVPAHAIPDYETYLQQYQNIPIYTGEMRSVEAEDAFCRSDSTLYPISDKSSVLVSPVKNGTILLNAIGGYRWSTANQSITWTVNVPQEGLYRVSFKVKQNVNNGQKSSRILMINGDIPFSEAMSLTVNYSTSWQILTPADKDGTPYLFYMRAGDNELKLQATLGESAEIVRLLGSSVSQLNGIYKELLMIIGSTPDKARDYKLDKLVPEQFTKMSMQADLLEYCAEWLENYNGSSNSGTGLMRTIVRQLREMSDDPDKVAKSFSYFKTNIGALGTWLATAKQQPLEMDFFLIGSENLEVPCAQAGGLAELWFSVKEFLHSFMMDYSSIGQLDNAAGEAQTSLKVWIASGRDQAQTLRSLINEDFTVSSGISVKLELVNAGTLLPATCAGNGPDVNLGGSDVINFAMRNAAVDLADFSDFPRIAGRFDPSTLIPLTYCGGVYGLPESLSFSVLFYRSDILEQLELDVPQTWDDVVAMSSVLAKNNMDFGLPASNGTYLLMLAQRKVPIYKNGGESCLLNGVEAIDTFRYYTNFYTNYGFPLSYDFVNRFRSGEMPVAVGDFNTFNALQVAAPEISGLWNFALIPGMQREDGSVDHTTLCGSVSCMILSTSVKQEAAWEFLKWWTSADVQTQYAREIESLLGISARYTSANLEAFGQSSWEKEDAQLLREQMQSLSAVENVPGGYYLTRHIDNAFRNVVYNGKKPMDVMYDYVHKINRELTVKREEFGLSIAQ